MKNNRSLIYIGDHGLGRSNDYLFNSHDFVTIFKGSNFTVDSCTGKKLGPQISTCTLYVHFIGIMCVSVNLEPQNVKRSPICED